MNLNEIANEYVKYIKTLPADKLYKFAHGNFTMSNAAFNSFLKTQVNLNYTQFKELDDQSREFNSYVKLFVDMPAKKVVKKKKQVEMSDDESF